MAQLETKNNWSQRLRFARVRRTLHHELRVAICDKICVQAWLGFGEVLFIGFGQNVIQVPEGERHPAPPIEIETNHADWVIRSVSDSIEIASNQDDRNK